MYGEIWILAWNFCYEWIDNIIKNNSGKAPFYHKGMNAILKIELAK